MTGILFGMVEIKWLEQSGISKIEPQQYCLILDNMTNKL